MMNHSAVFSVQAKTAPASARLTVAGGLVCASWLVYVGLEALNQSGRMPAAFAAPLEFLPGLVSVSALLWAGLTRRELYLRAAWPSRRGLLALAVAVPLMAPVFLSGTWRGFDPLSCLVYGTAGGLVQALYFRCALLPLLLKRLPSHPGRALCLVALLHGLWHVGPLVHGQPWYAVFPVMGIPFLVMWAWNWQTRHDCSVLWSAILQALIDQGFTLFSWGV